MDHDILELQNRIFHKPTNLTERSLDMTSNSVFRTTPAKSFCVSLLLLVLVLLTAAAVTPSAAAYSEADFVIGAAGELKQYKGSDTEVVIPSEVRVIDSSAFSGKQRLRSVVIPEGVTEIRGNAFYNCSSLKEISFPSTLTAIGSQAFANCDGLETLDLPSDLITIGENAFYDCDRLSSLTIPDSVEDLAKGAFSSCDKLTEVSLGTGVRKLGNAVFSGCSSLTAVHFSEGLLEIGNNAFTSCPIRELILPDSLSKMDVSALNSTSTSDPLKKSLVRVHWPYGLSTVTQSQFAGFQALAEVDIPEGVTEIGSSAFIN